MDRVFRCLSNIAKLSEIDKRSNGAPLQNGLRTQTLVDGKTVTRSDYNFHIQKESVDQANSVIAILQLWGDEATARHDKLARATIDGVRAVLGQLSSGEYLGGWIRRFGSRGTSSSEAARLRGLKDTCRHRRRRRLSVLFDLLSAWLEQPRQGRMPPSLEGSRHSTEIQLLKDTSEGLKVLIRHLEELKPWK